MTISFACDATSKPDEPEPGGSPPGVIYSGCLAILGSACIYGLGSEQELRLWVDVHPDRPLEVAIDGVQVMALQERVAAQSGQRLVLSLPPQAQELVLTTPGHAPWVLQVREAESGPQVREAEATRERADEAFSKQQFRQALAGYELAMQELVAASRTRAASDVALTATYLCAEILLDFECAEAWLDRHRGLFSVFPEARRRHLFYSGNLAERLGDVRQALADYRAHADYALRLGLDLDAAAALSAEAVLRGRLGDLDGSADALARTLGLMEGGSGDARGRLLNSMAWTWILARDRGLQTDDPRPLLREALAIFTSNGKEGSRTAAHVQVNLAFAELLEGNVAVARSLVSELPAASGDRRQELWRRYIALRIAESEGALTATLRGYEELATAADDAQSSDLQIRAIVGGSRALVAIGRPQEGVERLLMAERALDLQLSRLAVDGSRERYAAINDRSSREAVSLLLALGRERQALCVARLARRRSYEAVARLVHHRLEDLATVAERQRALARYQKMRAEIEGDIERSWTLPRRDGELVRVAAGRRAVAGRRELDAALAEIEAAPVVATTCEELARAKPGELVLALLPAADGWIGFAQLGPKIEVRSLDLPDPSDSMKNWSLALLGPFREMILGASRLRVISDGELLSVPIHALPLDGVPLFERLPVAYSLDLADSPDLRDGERSLGGASGGALVVAPPSNLLHAEVEVDEVLERLDELGFAVEVLSGDAATGSRVRARLGRAGLLHFVGHAHANPSARWDSALDLAGDSSLQVIDLIAAPEPAPRIVVLNGCRTGLASERDAAGGMSLAHAFLVAGSEVVIATTSDVDDAVAFAVIEALYAALAEEAEEAEEAEVDVVAALAKALAELRREGVCDRGSCDSYRAWVR